ncbi:MAG: ABC transporter permease [Thermomicrobia bacterium]|nr:ABC transporter permease [Thermomicrobia bacterium]
MYRYVIRRLLQLIPTILGVAIITFLVMKVTPGGPFDGAGLGRRASPTVVATLNAKYGLDQPLPVQFVRYITHALHGDFGVSVQLQQDTSVSTIIKQGLGKTMMLGFLALGVILLVSIPLGVIAALRQNRVADYVSLLIATGGASVPNFVLAILLVILFSVKLHLIPTQGWGTPKQAILPVITLAFTPLAFLTRITRSSMLDAMNQEYIQTARAKGLHERAVVIRHMLRNALIPVATVAGPLTAGLLTGSFIIENVFSIPGIGRLYLEAIQQRDYPVIMATTLLYAVILMLANLIVDLLYGVIDPRVRYS